MSNSKPRNFPTQQLADLEQSEPNAVQTIVTSLKQMHDWGQPRNDEEFERRIDTYFDFCQKSSMRPGIEGLCLALHCSRQSFWNWSNGIQCSERKQVACEAARSFISAFLEQTFVQGKLNPASGIFLLKNWCNYKDNLGFEIEATPSGVKPPKTREQLSEEFGSDNAEIDSAELELEPLPQI